MVKPDFPQRARVLFKQWHDGEYDTDEGEAMLSNELAVAYEDGLEEAGRCDDCGSAHPDPVQILELVQATLKNGFLVSADTPFPAGTGSVPLMEALDEYFRAHPVAGPDAPYHGAAAPGAAAPGAGPDAYHAAPHGPVRGVEQRELPGREVVAPPAAGEEPHPVVVDGRGGQADLGPGQPAGRPAPAGGDRPGHGRGRADAGGGRGVVDLDRPVEHEG